ncbi:MAG: CRISPR-associated endoribonuclease Cas6 [Caldilineales bacterium]
MLTSTVLTLYASPDAPAAPAVGRAAHAWFLSQIARHDPKLAATLHEPNHERPFTVSDLWRQRAPAEDAPAGHWYGLRLTTYEPQLSRLMSECLLPALPAGVTLGPLTLRLVDVARTAQQHPWAGDASFAGLVQTHTLVERAARSITLRFNSPTVFHSQGLFVPLPLPRLVFEGLLRRWNATAPITLPDELLRFADECVAISRHQLHSERVSFGEQSEHGAFPGFVGLTTYSFRVADRYWVGLICLLAAFALYAGIGQRTTMGLGQARLI